MDVQTSEEELRVRREQNDLKLKSRFASIFEKYGKDFDGVGDEIDLQSGRIVVDNGHIYSMTNEHDAGEFDDISDGQESEEWSEGDEMMTSVILSQFQQRIKALDAGEKTEHVTWKNIYRERSEDEDSLMGDIGSDSNSPTQPMETASPKSSQNEGPLAEVSNVLLTEDEPGHSLAAEEQREPPPMTLRKSIELHELPSEPIWRSSLSSKDETTPSNEDTSQRARQHISPSKREAAPESLPSASASHNEGDQQAGTEDTRTFWSYSYFPKADDSQHRPSSRPFSGNALVHKVSPHDLRQTKQTRIRWTDEENALLRHLKLELGLSYEEAAKHFPDRPKKSTVRHWIRLVKKIKNPPPPKPRTTTRIRWTAAENDQLRALMMDSSLGQDGVANHFPDRPKSSTMRHWARLCAKDQKRKNPLACTSRDVSFDEDDNALSSTELVESDVSEGEDGKIYTEIASKRLSSPRSKSRSETRTQSPLSSVQRNWIKSDDLHDGSNPSNKPGEAGLQRDGPVLSADDFSDTHIPLDLDTSPRDHSHFQQSHENHGENVADFSLGLDSHFGINASNYSRNTENTDLAPKLRRWTSGPFGSNPDTLLNPGMRMNHMPNEPLSMPLRTSSSRLNSAKPSGRYFGSVADLDLSDDELSGPGVINHGPTRHAHELHKSSVPELMIDPKLLDGSV